MEQPETIVIGPGTHLEPEQERLADIFSASYRRLVVQLYGVVGDAVEAEDLVQEAFVRAAAARGRFLKVHNPEAWLRTTAVNLHRNRWRKVRNWSRVREAAASTPRDLPGLEDHVVVVEALRGLPANQREVLALHYLADLGVAEIAETLKVPEGTVKSRLNRGRTALATLLSEEDDDD